MLDVKIQLFYAIDKAGIIDYTKSVAQEREIDLSEKYAVKVRIKRKLYEI